MNDTLETVKRYLEAGLKALRHDYKVEIKDEYVVCDAFTVCRTEWAGTGETEHADGSTEAERVEGFLIEVAVPIRGTRDYPPDVDVTEVEKTQFAHWAAQAVVRRLFENELTNLIHAEGMAIEEEDRRNEAEEVF